MRIRVTLEDAGGLAVARGPHALLLPNHISYLDVVVLGAHLPTRFVTSREIERTPVLGWLARAAGCLYCDRQARFALRRDVADLAGALEAGDVVTVFPEGTTTDGLAFLPFKHALLEAAVRAKSRVVPIALRYTAVDGAPFGPTNCDRVAWYGPMRFFPHLLQLTQLRRLDVRVTLLAPVPFREHRCRKRLGREVERLVAARYHEKDAPTL
jgi:1-acyl-sn-glycerol-3-phosphate acyltransferase